MRIGPLGSTNEPFFSAHTAKFLHHLAEDTFCFVAFLAVTYAMNRFVHWLGERMALPGLKWILRSMEIFLFWTGIAMFVIVVTKRCVDLIWEVWKL